ncbi:putative F-box/kelch-repeat protein At5g24040 [Carex rostrata]
MIPNKKSSRVNWAKLNPDLLHIISKKLFDISSFICFRAVCKRWRSATSLSDPPLQFPWLIDWPRCKGKLDFTFRFYSINTHKTHTFEVPDAHIYGPSDGRVMLYECYRSSEECQSFLNPLSWEEQFLPLEVPVDYDKWTKTRFPRTRTVAFYDHKFFVAEPSSKRITVIDEASGVVLPDIPHPSRDFYNGYLIATDDGLLAVEISILVSPFLMVDDLQKCEFDVYRLENYPQNSHWNKLNGIGDLMVFVDKNSGFSLKASDFGGGFRGNCIYFITKGNKPNRYGSEHVIGRFDIGLNKTEKMLTPRWLGNRTWERQAAWFMPTLN